jgi:hypothetical protein
MKKGQVTKLKSEDIPTRERRYFTRKNAQNTEGDTFKLSKAEITAVKTDLCD